MKQIIITVLSVLSAAGLMAQPQPGDIYREYSILTRDQGAAAWRVTDPTTDAAAAQAHLPNPKLNLTVSDLQGAVKAEVVLDYWSGHPHTDDRQFRINGKAWHTIPYPSTIPEPKDEYYFQYNPVISVPLSDLKEGTNTFQGTCSHHSPYGWGQWGWYMIMVRVYYNSSKAHPSGSIAAPAAGASLGENPVIIVNASAAAGIERVEVLGRYNGFDENGDGVFDDYHGAYRSSGNLSGHVGLDKVAPYRITWNTADVPDQKADAVSLVARIKGKNDVWYVTPEKTNLSFARTGKQRLTMYKCFSIPKQLRVRDGQQKSVTITATNTDGLVSAKLHHLTWNGLDDVHKTAVTGSGSGSIANPLTVNSAYKTKVGGINHDFYYSRVTIPVQHVKFGSNRFMYESDTEHHGIEVLWPGPALLLTTEQTTAVSTPQRLYCPEEMPREQLFSLDGCRVRNMSRAGSGIYVIRRSNAPGREQMVPSVHIR